MSQPVISSPQVFTQERDREIDFAACRFTDDVGVEQPLAVGGRVVGSSTHDSGDVRGGGWAVRLRHRLQIRPIIARQPPQFEDADGVIEVMTGFGETVDDVFAVDFRVFASLCGEDP